MRQSCDESWLTSSVAQSRPCWGRRSGQEGGKLAENWANAGSRRFLQFFRQLGVREVRAGRRTRLSHSPAALGDPPKDQTAAVFGRAPVPARAGAVATA